MSAADRAAVQGFRRRLVALVRKETRQLLRDRANIAIGVALPIILILLFGYGLSLDVRNAPVAVVLDDHSPAAIESISGLELSPYLSPRFVPSMRDAEALMHRREVDGIVRLPSDFASRRLEGEAQIQVIVHGADAARARSILGYVEGALAIPAARAADRAGGGAPPVAGRVAVEQRLWFNAANSSTWFLVPGLVVLIMTMVGALLTSLVVAREWERGTLEALFVTPVRPTEILLAKLTPYFCVGLVGLAFCLIGARLLFQVPIYGSLWVILLASILYLLVALSIGLVISSATRNQFQASQITLVVTLLPAMMLSGFMFDLRNMPDAIRIIGQALPATYFLELLKSLFLAGNIWPLIIRNCAILAAYALAFLVLARAVTRKRLD